MPQRWSMHLRAESINCLFEDGIDSFLRDFLFYLVFSYPPRKRANELNQVGKPE